MIYSTTSTLPPASMPPSQEKAQSALYRFRQVQAIEMNMPMNGPPEARPKTTAGVTSLRDCERWRKEIIRELDRRISKIQDCTSPSNTQMD